MKRSNLLLATVLAILIPLEAPAASSGLAWDSVSKFAMNVDPSSLQPGDFSADFAAAATTQMPPPGSGGGILGPMRAALAAGQGIQQMMQNGMASREYTAGPKHRVDMLAMQRAFIIDCTTRTFTTLDLQHKTYKIVSMDQTSAQGSPGIGTPSPTATAMATSLAITLKNTALGARDVGGLPTDGFRTDMTIAQTSGGETQTEHAQMLSYYSNVARPVANCDRVVPSNGNDTGAAAMGSYTRILQALTSRADSNMRVQQSGPPLPFGRLTMYDATTFVGGSRGSVTFITERGNVRSISADDPIFSIPAGFTAQQ